MSHNLPEFPNLEHLKKQAKVLLRELQRQNPEARLREAYHLIARGYGFASWPKLKAHVESLPGPTSPPAPVETSALRGGGGGSGGLFPRFTDKARRTIFFARCLAEEGNEVIAPEQLLVGLFQADSDLASSLFPGRFQTLPANSTKEVERLTGSFAERIPQLLRQGVPRTTTGESFPARVDSRLSRECRGVLDQAAREADRLGHERIGTGHLLLGFLSEDALRATPSLSGVLPENGSKLDAVRDQIVRFLGDRGSV